MAVLKIARFEIRPEGRIEVERAMHAFATYVRTELPKSAWTMFRDPHAPTHYVAMVRSEDAAADAAHEAAPGTRAFRAAIAPFLVGDVEVTECELVTSSDLQRRVRSGADRGGPRPPRRGR